LETGSLLESIIQRLASECFGKGRSALEVLELIRFKANHDSNRAFKSAALDKFVESVGIKDKSFLQIDVNIETRQIILTPLRGKYKGKGLMKALMANKRRERQL